MTLQGPHQVANASRTTTLLSLMTEANSALLELIRQYTARKWRSATKAEGGETYFETLWTPILTFVFLNPLMKLVGFVRR
jgi:hypothetical protein